MRCTERLNEIGALDRNIADSFDNALAEMTNGLCRTEGVCGVDTSGWTDVDEPELAMLSWTH